MKHKKILVNDGVMDTNKIIAKGLEYYKHYMNSAQVVAPKTEHNLGEYEAPDRDGVECIDNPGFVGKTHITAYDKDIDIIYNSFEELAKAVGIDVDSDHSELVELDNRNIFVEDPNGNLKRVEKMCAVFTDTLYTISLGDEFTVKIRCSGSTDLATVEKATCNCSDLEEDKDKDHITLKHNVIVSGRNLASLTYDIMNSDIAYILHKRKVLLPYKEVSIKNVRTKIYSLQVEDNSMYNIHGFYTNSYGMHLKEE